MTATVADLIAEASKDLDSVSRALLEGRAPQAGAAAAAWPAVLRAGQRLVANAGGPTSRVAPINEIPPAPEHPGITPDPVLAGVAARLGAAADLLVDSRLSAVTSKDRQDAITHTAGVLAAAAQITTQATVYDLTCAGTASSAAAATQACAHVLATGIAPDAGHGPPGLLEQATTSALRLDSSRDPHGLLDGVDRAAHQWRRVALATTQSPAPSSYDLRTAALTAGRLSALAHVLLIAHHQDSAQPAAQPAGGGSRDGAAPAESVRQAGLAWNQVARTWGRFTLAAPPTTDGALAARDVDVAVRRLAHDGPAWASPDALAKRAPAAGALLLGRTLMLHARDVAADHAQHVEHLARARRVLGRADHFPNGPGRLSASIRKQWVPLHAVEVAPLAHGYSTLTWATQQAARSYAAIASSARPDLVTTLLADISQRPTPHRQAGHATTPPRGPTRGHG